MNKKCVFSITTFIIGIIALIAGVVFLVIRLINVNSMQDGEFLVSIGEWVKENGKCEQLKCAENTKCMDENGESALRCEDGGVIWNFTEIGKGTLTTNDHLNDYDFSWALENGKIIIKTDWLYTMNDEFDYELDKNNNILTITREGEEAVKFVPVAE